VYYSITLFTCQQYSEGDGTEATFELCGEIREFEQAENCRWNGG